jgi:chromosome partitioning protein
MRQMLTIAIASTKGGVGKTTTAASVGVRAAQDSARVALVDLDPQRALVEWWRRRGETDNPCIFQGCDKAADAIERLELDGWDYVILDGPPAFLQVVSEMVNVAHFTLIPCKPSMIDILAMQDVISFAREAGSAHMVVLNDVPTPKLAETARSLLTAQRVPVAKCQISHRPSHIAALAAGKSAAEINKGRDKVAATEIDALWLEVKAAAAKAAKARRKEPIHG